MKVSFNVNGSVALKLKPETELETTLMKQMEKDSAKGVAFKILGVGSEFVINEFRATEDARSA